MTDSSDSEGTEIKLLTESVNAVGNNLEGRGQEWERQDALYNADPQAYQDACWLKMTQELYEATKPEHDQPFWRGNEFLHARLHNMLFPKANKKNRHTLGPREFTLTYSTKWFADDDEARRALTKAIDKLIKYYQDEIIQLRAVGEVGKNGASHIHCYYELQGGRKITDKNFKRAWSYWDPSKKHGKGFQGGHHEEVKSAADFLGYIDKEIDSSWLEKNINNKHTPCPKEEVSE